MDVDPDMPDRENPFDPVDPGDDEGESIPMTSTSTRDTFHHHTTYETSFIENEDEDTPLIRREENVENAWERIREKYPNADPANSSFTATLDEYDRVAVKLKRVGSKRYTLFKPDGQPNDKLPKKILDSLGPTAEEVLKVNENEISRRSEKVRELESARKQAGADQRENIERNIDIQRDEIDKLERENEAIEERMSLRDRIKAIFKKYAFTAFAVLSAVGAVIGVIVSNLKSGLSILGKGFGNGLKAIGKKLGEILPGMVGAIASFIFKTAGEAIGFLAKNAWLLVVAVVVYVIDRVKNKQKIK